MTGRVMAAMSGGVDSSVCAYLLLKDGYDVRGVTLKLFSNEDLHSDSRSCCSLLDVQDAGAVCRKLGIRHDVYNYSLLFKEKVIEPFVKAYIDGKTPNPCIECNKHIKFSALMNRAALLEYDFLATGHYAQIEKSGERFLLKKGVDNTKDQSYVLYMLTQDMLSRLKLPLGALTKLEARELAERAGLINARKPDSQDICFVTNGDYADFISTHTGIEPELGDFLDTDGHIIGRHRGIINYTIGQRKGLGAFSKPMFVVDKNKEKNTVTLGESDALYGKKLMVRDINLIPFDRLTEPMRVGVRIRYNQKEQPATLHPIDEHSILVEFNHSQRAITPGQAAVFYDGECVVGGGVIE